MHNINMVKISQNMLLPKWIEPIWIVGFCSWFIIDSLITQSYLESAKYLVIPIGLLLFCLALYVEMVWGMVDVVYDSTEDKCLIVKNGRHTSKILYSNIKEVEFIVRQVPKKVILHLVQPEKNFGQKVLFAPALPRRFWSSERNAVVEQLIVNIEKAKLK